MYKIVQYIVTGFEIKHTHFSVFQFPQFRFSSTSPTERNSGGFLCTPTPAGVPVSIKSPGYKVTILKIP